MFSLFLFRESFYFGILSVFASWSLSVQGICVVLLSPKGLLGPQPTGLRTSGLCNDVMAAVTDNIERRGGSPGGGGWGRGV